MNSKAYYILIIIYILFVAIKNLISFNPFGLHFYSLYSSSMEPSIPPGSLVVVQRQESGYRVGDVVAYWAQIDNHEVIVAHRIVRLGGNVYVTRGDNNRSDDSLVILPRLIIGKVVFISPLTGYLFSFLTSPPVSFGLVFIPAVFIIFIESKRLRSLFS